MFNYIVYRLGQFIAMALPLRISYFIAVALADLNYIFNPVDRQAIRENLRVIFPKESSSRIKQIHRKTVRNFAKYLVDFFRFTEIDKEYIKKNVHLKDIHYFDEALAKGKGAIVLTAHLGNWELGGVVIGLLGYPFYVVALPHKHKKVNDFFNHQRQSKGVKVIALGRAVKASLNALKENKLLALVGDREFTKGGITIDFFGKPTLLPQGPAVFALKTGAPIIPGFMVRNPDDSFTLQFEKPIEGQNYSFNELINRYKIILEDYIRKYPDQWYMFRKFWSEEK